MPLASSACALWAGWAVLDLVQGANGPIRVALLPSLLWLAALLAIAVSIVIVLARGRRDPDAALPLCALIVLALPYLPWLPDRLPVLRAGAGPGRDLLWIVIAWLVAGKFVAQRFAALPQRATLVFLASLLVYGAAGWRMAGAKVSPTGDEPHYLVMTQSLLRDHDLRIENNHQRGDYREYFAAPLRPDYLTRGVDRQIYSVHPVGLPVLALPAFAIAGYPGVVAMLVLMAALAAAIGWQWARETTGSAGAATFAWASVALTAPFLFNSFTVFPEIPGALAVMVALAWRHQSRSPLVFLARGLAIAALPWLSTKYVPMAFVIGMTWLFRMRFKISRETLAFVAPVVVSLAGWFTFFYVIWGTFAPSAPYGSQDPMTLRNLAHGLPGLLFDQEYGVVFVAPVLALAALGVARMWKSGADVRRSAIEIAAAFAALIVTVGAFHVWWGGTASPGRPLVSAVLLCGAPIAIFYAAASRRLKIVAHALLALSLVVSVAMGTAVNGALLHNGRDGSAALLEWISPLATLAPAFPSFIAGGVIAAFTRSLAWLALGALVAMLAGRRRPAGDGAFTFAILAFALTGGVGLVSLLGGRVADVAVESRARVALLDSFDARARPVGVVFDPFLRTTPDDIVRRVAFVSRAGLRTAPQPVDLLWNTRLALPAGEYAVEFTRPNPQQDATLSLQAGRRGPALETWTLAGLKSEHRFTLPTDVSFAGFTASAGVAESAGELRVRPLQITNASERLERAPVLSAYHYGPVAVFFHTDGIAAEPAGFWTMGEATARFTFAGDASVSSVTLALRCGPVANRVTLTAGDWQTDVDVAVGATKSASVPLQPRLGQRFADLDIKVANAFVPAEADKASGDRRKLGCWVEMPSAGTGGR